MFKKINSYHHFYRFGRFQRFGRSSVEIHSSLDPFFHEKTFVDIHGFIRGYFQLGRFGREKSQSVSISTNQQNSRIFRKETNRCDAERNLHEVQKEFQHRISKKHRAIRHDESGRQQQNKMGRVGREIQEVGNGIDPEVER